jgi:hypothetical protein
VVHNGIVVESQNLVPKILTKMLFVSNYYYDYSEKKEQITRLRRRPKVLNTRF